MSMYLTCRKFLPLNVKSKIFGIINSSSSKIHSNSRVRLLKGKDKYENVFIKRSIFTWFKKPKKADLKIIDNIPDQYELIYRSTAERYIYLTQLLTTAAAIIVLVVVVVTSNSSKKEMVFENRFQFQTTLHTDIEDFQIFVTAFFSIIILLHLLINKVPLRIYYLSQQKKYIFILPSSLPMQSKRLVCKIGEIEKDLSKGILPWKESKFILKKEKSVVLMEENFRTPSDLYIMLGVQRDPNDVDE